MKEKSKKSSVITIRCTPDMEQRIKNKAGQLGKPVSEVTLDWISASLKNNTKGDKLKARTLVETQEMLNTLISSLKMTRDKQIIEQLENISKEMIKLWDY